jgi:predicted 3-demethylubiquinone-9 3-methyltransferase (glyoxalase superfamily)
LKITPTLWFDDQAEAAAQLYTSVFKNSRIGAIARYPEAAHEVSGKAPGSVMTVEFELEGQPFVALNGGPQFTFDEAVSFMVTCEDQAEIDYFWEKLTADGGEEGPCGWLKDRFGLSWQIVPDGMNEMLGGDPKKVEAVTAAFLRMKKIDFEALKRIYAEA